MEKLSEAHGIDVMDRAMRYLRIRLGSREDTRELAVEVEASRVAVGEVYGGWFEARDQRVAQTAAIDWLQVKEEEAIMDLGHEALSLVDRDRQDPRYLRLFAQSPSAVARELTDAEREIAVRRLVEQVGTDPELAPLADSAARLMECTVAVAAAIEVRKALEVTEGMAMAVRREVADQGRTVYNATWLRLSLLFPKDAALVNSFFLKLRSQSEASEAEQDTGDAENEDEATSEPVEGAA